MVLALLSSNTSLLALLDVQVSECFLSSLKLLSFILACSLPYVKKYHLYLPSMYRQAPDTTTPSAQC